MAARDRIPGLFSKDRFVSRTGELYYDLYERFRAGAPRGR